MSHRAKLLSLLYSYEPQDELQKSIKSRFIDFVLKNEDCFLRSNSIGHITGSCWLLSPNKDEVLLTHHKKIGIWVQLGGHADGDNDIMNVTLKEAEEESGICGIKPIFTEIFDLDIHEIQKHRDVDRHLHFDVGFALQSPRKDYTVSHESHDLAWISIEKLAMNNESQSLSRMAKNWLQFSKSQING